MQQELLEQIILDRLQTIEELQNKYLPFKLGEEQKTVLFKILEYIDSFDDDILTLSGCAGSGKSSCMKLVIEYLETVGINYLLAAPTNKASNVLSQWTQRESITLHRLLELKPTLDIMLLDFKDLKYTTNSNSSGIPYKGVLIVDECSMINDVLYDFIVNKSQEKNAKIIFVGDVKQCAPVKESHISKAFSKGIQLQLNEVYRQEKDNPILNVLDTLRNQCIYNFSSIVSNNGSIVIYNDWKRLIKNTKKLFIKAIEHQNPTEVKLIAYTNKRIEAFNSIIRESLFEEAEEYQIGEFLTGYDTTVNKVHPLEFGFDIINSEDYIIKDLQPSGKFIGDNYFSGYILSLKEAYSDKEGDVFIISKKEPQCKFDDLAKEIENIRISAISIKDKKRAAIYWKKYFSMMESFLTPVDLIYNDRTIRKKSLDYGYCISVHKSQGSTIDNVLVDMSNLFVCRNKEDLRQLQYVALSRTKNNIVMLI